MISISSITKLESESESLVTGFSTTRSKVFLTVFSTVCVTLLVTVLTSLEAALSLILVLELLVVLPGADFVRLVLDACVFEVVVLEVVLVVGSLNPVYSSHFGPMTSFMPPQISSLFVDEVDGVDLTDEDEDAESDFVDPVVPLAVFQISNIPLVLPFLTTDPLVWTDTDTDSAATLPLPFQNPNPLVPELSPADAVVEAAVTLGVLLLLLLLLVVFSKRSLLCSCVLRVYGSESSLQRYGRRRTARPMTMG
jgi:hypothetical protein